MIQTTIINESNDSVSYTLDRVYQGNWCFVLFYTFLIFVNRGYSKEDNMHKNIRRRATCTYNKNNNRSIHSFGIKVANT